MCASKPADQHLKKAVALRYDQHRDQAPRMVAKGRNRVADHILALADAHDIPIREDKNLVQVLEALPLEAEIPPELYRAIAEILVFVYRLNQNK